ncbi:MAG: branched-chain amino acid transaminase [Candidatus Micrarchaeaceae archaeon]
MVKSYIWFDGKIVEREKLHFDMLTHSLQYGSGIFEGLRTYKTEKGIGIFRLRDHMARFLRSAKIYDMKIEYSLNKLENAVIDVVKKNKIQSGYIRPFGFYNDSQIGLDVSGKKISVGIAAVEFGKYFKQSNKGISCIISSWRRINSEILPPQAKSSGNYLNSIIASNEAKNLGADEAILLGSGGYVAEGPGENIFLVKNNELITPSEESDILIGITRDSIIKIAESKGIIVKERLIHREELYTADEMFFCGTAAEITPIIMVDRKIIGKGTVGPFTKMISDTYSEITSGNNEEFDWITLCKN